jgi:membrane protease YdiL (CAAX protease family)
VVCRAALVALLVLHVGQAPGSVALLLNLRLAPRVPLFLPLTAAWLWVFWRYVGGRGWPPGTAAQRRLDLRATSLPRSVWLWSLAAGGVAQASVLSLALLTSRIARLPARAYEVPFDLSPYPWWTVLSFFLVIAGVAGVVEEAAFRGYMLSQIERRHGWGVAIGLVAAMFYVVHLSHAYATLAFVPFFVAFSLVQGLLVFTTRSILPSVVVHAVGDFCILPIQYGVIDLPFGPSPWPYLAGVVAFGLLAVPAFGRLRTLTR